MRQEDGPSKIATSIENVQKLAERDMELLNEVCAINVGVKATRSSTAHMRV